MRTKSYLFTLCIALIALALTVVGCGSSGSEKSGGAKSDPATTTETTATTEKPKPKPGSKLKVLNSTDYGSKYLTDSKGLTLYLFTKEKSDKSECYGDCATAWPPFLTKGEPVAGKGVDQELLGTTKRDDGKTQVTYDGHPLYYYVDEDEAGEILCQAVPEFGGIWYIVKPDGEAVT